MSADQGSMATPVIVRSDPYAKIESFSQHLIAEDSHKWCAIMPWDYPKTGTKEAEDEFLLHFFKDDELHIHSPKFLAQVWKCIALYNAQFRIPAVVEKWIEDNTELWKDSSMTKHIFSEDARPSSVFSDPELKAYPDAFLRVAVKGIQTRLKNMDVATKVAEAQEDTSAVNNTAVQSTGAKVDALSEAGPSTIKTAVPTQIEPHAFTEPRQNLGDATIQHQVPAMLAHSKPFSSRPNGASDAAYAQPDHRPSNHKKPRGGHNTKRGSFGARNGNGPVPPPGFENTRQPSNPFSHPCGPPPALNATNGLPYMMPGRVPSGGQQFGGHEQNASPHLQFQQPQGPLSTAYMPPIPPPHAPRYSLEQGMPGPRLYNPGNHGTHMQYNGPQPGPQQMPPMMDRTNLQGSAPSFDFQTPTYGHDGRPPNRRGSVASRGGKRGYGGSIRGKGSRGGRDSFSYSENIAHESNDIPDTKPRWIIQRGKNSLDDTWRSSQTENLPRPSQDARNSISYLQKPSEHMAQSGTHGSFGAPHQAHDKVAFSQPLCTTTCTKSEIAADCTTATKLIVFDTANGIPETEIKTYFSQFGTVTHIGGLKSPSLDTTHCHIWITFATVAEARECLTARGQYWPFGFRKFLQVENARQHWDSSHRLHQSQHSAYAPSAPCFIPHHGIQTTTDLSSRPVSQEHIPDALPEAPVATDGVASMLSQDTTPAASGTTTPKKKAKTSKKKKPKKTELLAEATTKVLAEAELCSDQKSSDGDKTPSVVDSKVSVLSEAHESPVDEAQEALAGTVEHGVTEALKLDEPPVGDRSNPAGLSPQAVESATILNDDARLSGTPAAAPVVGVSEDLPTAVESAVLEPDSCEPGPDNEKDSAANVTSSPQGTTDVPAAQQDGQTVGANPPKASVQSPSSVKSSKKAPIPKVPGSRTVSVALPDLTVKVTSPAVEPANKDEREVPDSKNVEADKIGIFQQRSISGGSEGTIGYFTAPATPATGLPPTLPTEEVVPHVRSVAQEPQSMKPLKPKGPEQTESFSVFSSKAKKEKRKASKSTKAKGSIKGKPAPADVSSQGTSGAASGTDLTSSEQPSLQSTEAVHGAVIRKPINAPRPEHRFREPAAVEAAVSAGEEVTSLPSTVTDSPPRPVRRGTIGTIGDLISYIRGGSQGSLSTTNSGQTDSKSEEKVDPAKDTADDCTAPPSAPNVVSDGARVQADGLEATGLGISNDATNGQAKSKKKKTKSKGKKEAQADITASEPKHIEMNATEPLYTFSGNDAQPEAVISVVDNSTSSDSPPGRKTRVYSHKEKHIIEPKPLRKTHKRAASSRVSSDDGTDQSSAVATSNRRSSKEVSATQTGRRPPSPPFTILVVSPRADSNQVVDYLLQQDRVEEVTDVNKIDTSDSKVFDVNGKADANNRVSPEVEGMRARMNELQQKEQKVKQSKGKEMAEAQ